MRRALLAGPLALYSSACALRAWTPSANVAYWAEAVPAPAGEQVVPAKGDAIRQWQLPPPNPWARYEKLTLLSSLDMVPRAAALPDVRELDVVENAQRAAMNVAAAGLPNDTMWIIDLRGAA